MNAHGSNLRTGHKSVRSFWEIHKILRNIVLKFTFPSFTTLQYSPETESKVRTNMPLIKLKVYNE